MKLILLHKHHEAPDVVTFEFQPSEPLTWKAGQYGHFVLHHEPTDSRGSDRWFTFSSAPYEKTVKITTRLATQNGSTFKATLKNLELGKSIEISDIGGEFVIDDHSQQYVFIAGGIGITPFCSILKQLDRDHQPVDIILLYALRDEHVPFKEELEQLAKRNPGLSIQYVVSPEKINEATIKQFVPNLTKPIFYVSGPEPMVDSLGSMLKKMGAPENHLKQDWFPGYASE